ncbi:diguanylate cyclase [Luteimonas sp. MJ174]|uniref:diguanylate cyclase n=1 Tax=Luteimonas sp. MJ174 TaxID=3129237 RepID=UPI0031BB4C95
MWCSLWLFLFLLLAGQAAASVPLVLQAVTADVESDVGPAAAAAGLRAGRFQDRLEPPGAPVIQEQAGEVHWWRITTPEPLPAAGSPKLVLRSPFLNRVQAWVPGRSGPSRHALYGAHADSRYSQRALVVDLPEGIPAGEAVWLRVDSSSSVAMPVAIEALDQVHRADLAFVAWRVFVLSVLSVLALLAFAFCFGTGESSLGWFGGMLCFAVLYMVSLGGDLRLLPGAEALLGNTPQANRVIGGLGIVFSNLFQRRYLDLPGKLPGMDRVLWVGSGLAAMTALGSVFVDAGWLARIGNGGLVLSAALLLFASAVLSLRGDRAGRVVLASWLPLMTFTTLVALEMMGLWTGPPWLAQGLAASFALAGLLLTIGLADKLLELRRDRDRASALARADDLTGMLNRSGVEEELRKVLHAAGTRSMPVSIAFVDIDRFKRINDAYGHRIGDQCLRIVSLRIRNQLRGRDIIGRYGGDEFLVVMPDTALHEARAVAARMLSAVNSRPLTMDQTQLDCSLSIGLAELAPGESPESLVERADAALYASKQAGRDRLSLSEPAPAPATS